MSNQDSPPSGANNRFLQLLFRWLPNQRAESKADVLENLRMAEQDGIVARDAYDMMQRVISVSDLKVRDIMIPRSSMVFVDKENNLDECLDVMVESAHSRFPVVDNERDQIIGILLAKDLLKFFDEEDQEKFNLRDLTRPAVFVPESKRLNVLLAEFRQNRNHMAIVVDEYASVAGLVTIEDVLEQIVGDIEDEHDIDDDESMIRELGDGETIIKAALQVDEFNEHFNASLLEGSSDTVGGLISQTVGHVPQRGEVVRIDEFRFEIVHADNRRVHLISVRC
jgi:magnesium and cobalt transporter